MQKIIDEIKQYNAVEWAYLLLIIAIVVGIGLFGVNQYLAFRYKAIWLSTPCELCLELNDHVDLCPKQITNLSSSFLELPELP